MLLTKVLKTQNGSFQLTFQSGLKVNADILVLAIPCSVYEQVLFEDGIIPKQRLEAIQSI